MTTPVQMINSNYPSVSDVHLCTAAGQNMTRKIYTAANGRFSTKVGMKQPNSLAYGYQIQYRSQSRYTLANETAKGATWTAKTAWKNDRAFSQDGTTYPVGSTFDVYQWKKCNVGVNKNSTYHAFDSFENSYVGGDYDCRWYQYRIRTYSPKTGLAGAWYVSNGLYIYKAADVRDITLYRGMDGGLVIRCNYNFDRGVTFELLSYTDEGGEQNYAPAKATAYAINTDNARGTLLPAARTGYMAGIIRIPLDGIGHHAPEAGERYTLDGYARTTDGARTRITGTYTVQAADELINKPAVTVADNGQQFGIPRVTATLSDPNDIVTGHGCTASYTVNAGTAHAEKVTIKPTKTSVTGAGTSAFTVVYEFANAPVETEIKFSVTFKNGVSSAVRSVTYSNAATPGAWYLQSIDEPNTRATLQYNIRFTAKTVKPYTIEQPHGRLKPWAAYGVGNNTTMSLDGVVVADAVAPPDMLGTSSLAAWQWLQQNQGVYRLRAPGGRFYNVAVTDATITAENDKIHNVSLSLIEVE